jgi:hypothetical protein
LTPNRIATRGLILVETRITYSVVKEQREVDLAMSPTLYCLSSVRV